MELFVLIFVLIPVVLVFILALRGWWYQRTYWQRMSAPLSYQELIGSWEGPPDPKQAALDYNIEKMGLSAYTATLRGIMVVQVPEFFLRSLNGFVVAYDSLFGVPRSAAQD
jgi:hypothetical protein